MKTRIFYFMELAIVSVLAIAVTTTLIFYDQAGTSGQKNTSESISRDLNAIAKDATGTDILESGSSKGSVKAPITIIIYSDFQCARCQQFALTVEKDIDKAYVETGIVRLVRKHFLVYGDKSLLAAEASECAAEQNKFWPYYDALMQSQAFAKQDITFAYLEELAQQLGLDTAIFKSSLESGKYKGKVLEEDTEGRNSGVTGTPTFSINGIMERGTAPFDSFQKAIDILQKGTAS